MKKNGCKKIAVLLIILAVTPNGLFMNFESLLSECTGIVANAENIDLNVHDISVDPQFSNVNVTLNDGLGLNFYVDNITDSTGYTVKFSGLCDENDKEVNLIEKNGKFCATANINAHNFKENIKATLYKDGVTSNVTITKSVNDYLIKALATNDFNNKTRIMLKATQLYCYAADEYFNAANNNVSTLISEYMASLNLDDTTLKEALIPYAPTFSSEQAKVSMVLNSKVKLRVYSDNGTNENNYGKYSEITGLTPISMTNNQIIDGYSVSGYTWVYRVLNANESDTKNVNMAKAMFAYMKAAENFITDNVESVSNTDVPTEDVQVNTTDTLNTFVSTDITTPQICMCYGDSLTWYDGHEFTWGDNQGETCIGFETYFEKNLGLITFNEGISGETTPQICERVSCDSATANADIITIMGGDNDDRLSVNVGTLLPAGSSFDTTTVYGALQNAIETLLDKNPNVKIILMTEPMGWTYRDNEMICVDDVYPEAYRQVAAQYGLPLIDNWKYSGINEVTRNIYYVDPTPETNTLYMYHPNNIGWECISMYICQEIVRYI